MHQKFWLVFFCTFPQRTFCLSIDKQDNPIIIEMLSLIGNEVFAMDSELYFPAISDIFTELENSRATVFHGSDKCVEKFFADMAAKSHLDNRFLILIPASYWDATPIGQHACRELMLVTPKPKNSEEGSAEQKNPAGAL